MAFWLNKDLKFALYDSIDTENIPSLAFRCFQGCTTIFFSFWIIQYYSLTTVATFRNIAPLLVVILAYFILQERLFWYQTLGLVICFIGCSMVLFGASLDQDQN